jgi:hypothetical protein
MVADRPLQALDAAAAGAVRLVRNEAVGEPLGGRTWRGVLANATDRAVADLQARIGFHDEEGRSVGAPVTARAGRLAPGAALNLQARLPASAVGLSIDDLRWTADGRSVEIVGGEPWRFGVVQR